MAQHKHAALIIAKANDTTLEIQYLTDKGNWFDTTDPRWTATDYRIKPQPHVHQDLMDMQKADSTLKFEYWIDLFGGWTDVEGSPLWCSNTKYRVKPKTKLVKKWQWVYRHAYENCNKLTNNYFATQREVEDYTVVEKVYCKADWTEITVEENV